MPVADSDFSLANFPVSSEAAVDDVSEVPFDSDARIWWACDSDLHEGRSFKFLMRVSSRTLGGLGCPLCDSLSLGVDED